jgi:sugar phosphate permease
MMGLMIEHGFGWQSLFWFAAAVAGALWLANGLLLRESRTELGHAEARANPHNLYATAESRPVTVAEFVRPLLTSGAFCLVCLLSFGCTVIRETFNNWTSVYLHDAVGYSTARAAGLSAVFPAVGAVSVLVTGWLSDRLGPNGRPILLLAGLTATAAALVPLTLFGTVAGRPEIAVLMIGVVAFCLLGPYSYLGGAFALDFGGKRAGAASSGIIDGVGYLGGTLAGDGVARISVAYGWRGVFFSLAAVSAASAIAAGFLYIDERRRFVGRR